MSFLHVARSTKNETAEAAVVCWMPLVQATPQQLPRGCQAHRISVFVGDKD